MIKEINKEKRGKIKGVVLDMDDTIAHFNDVPNAVQIFSTNPEIFKDLKPSKLLLTLKYYIKNNTLDKNKVFIISASPNDSADKYKKEWVGKYFKEIPEENIHLVRNGEDKGKYFKKVLKEKDLKGYILIDDYTKNLIDWSNLKGTSLKYINDYNNKTKNYLKYDIESLDLKDINSLRNFLSLL